MRLPLPSILILLILAILATEMPMAFSAGTKAQIVDLVLDKSSENLEVSFRIAECFTPKMEEAVQSGVPTTFRILVTIEKPSLVVIKSRVAEFVLEHTIKYNRLNNEYQVQVPEDPRKVIVTKDFDEAKSWMSMVRSLQVTHKGLLDKDQDYVLKIKAELSKVELPLFFRYILFWVSLWDFETDWHKVDFSM